MTLLKIGSRHVNLDLVRYAEEDGAGGVRLVFAGKGGEVESMDFTGAEGEALKQWLHRNSTEAKLLPPSWHRG